MVIKKISTTFTGVNFLTWSNLGGVPTDLWGGEEGSRSYIGRIGCPIQTGFKVRYIDSTLRPDILQATSRGRVFPTPPVWLKKAGGIPPFGQFPILKDRPYIKSVIFYTLYAYVYIPIFYTASEVKEATSTHAR